MKRFWFVFKSHNCVFQYPAIKEENLVLVYVPPTTFSYPRPLIKDRFEYVEIRETQLQEMFQYYLRFGVRRIQEMR